MTKNAQLLELQEVSVTLAGKPVLQNVNLTVKPGETVALLGASGSGKSTLLRAIAGLEPLAGGQIMLGGRELTRTPAHLRGVGFVFQDGQLFTHRTVAKNISYGLENMRPKLGRAARQARVRELLELVNLPGFEMRKVQTLSGGQAQRVALARALAPEPALLLLDEPLSALDAELRQSLGTQLRQIVQNKTAILVTHDIAEAAQIADRVVRLDSLQNGSDTLKV